MPQSMSQIQQSVRDVVAAIPLGRVTTYGLVARRLHLSPRQVAAVLAHLSPTESADLPWYRVVAANGVLSTIQAGRVGRRQAQRLRAEGIAVSKTFRVEDFAVIVWDPV